MNDAPSEPVLRTLAPALRELERRLRVWLKKERSYPLSTLQSAALEGLADDLGRQSAALQQEQPLLVVMLMGGTGVGKSSLLNALAGGAIAQASFQRPTTRDPVVYYHQSIRPEKLDPALKTCRLASHDREVLRDKILVDTPDLDSNDIANRNKLLAVLPVADIVLYVGSQEKYHDQIGWNVFLEQRRRRAFAFVLNKWDRCQSPTNSGVRPDEDLLVDLRKEGFENPKIFRTCAQHWIDHPWQGVANPTPAPVEGEQFLELVRWLEYGLNRVEIESIKSHGVVTLLQHLDGATVAACPPDLTLLAERTRTTWSAILAQEASEHANILIDTLHPYHREIEHHFALERQQQFRGFMSTYLYWFNKIKYSGSSLRDHIPFLPKSKNATESQVQWSLQSFSMTASRAASEQHLDARLKALANKLLVAASDIGFPVNLLTEPTENSAKMQWQGRYAQAMVEILSQVERAWSNPTGWKKYVQGLIIFLADWVPVLAGGTMVTMLLWGYTVGERRFAWLDLVLPAIVMVLVVMFLHFLVAIFLPLRWSAIRTDFEDQLQKRLSGDLEAVFTAVPGQVAQTLLTERQDVEQYMKEVRDVLGWLEKCERTASVQGLYGNAMHAPG